MPFPLHVRLEALIACQRECCLCHQRKHTFIQCHHIIQEANGGPDSFDNCIPLCPDCHAAVLAFNPRHPVGATPYHPEELRRRRDDWYASIARRANDLAKKLHSSEALYPHTKSLQGIVTFNYSHYNGHYRIGEGNSEFLTRWIKSSSTNIQCYSHGTNLSLALAPKDVELGDITQASLLNFTSSLQRPQSGQFIVFENHTCRYAAAKILKIQDDTRGAPEDLLVFQYWILEDGSDDFSGIP